MLGVMRRLTIVAALAVVIAGMFAAAMPAASFAVTQVQTCSDGTTIPADQVCKQKCPDGSTVPDGQDCAVSGTGNCSGDATGGQNLQNCDLISKYINPLINLFSALVGVIIVIALIMAGIQYSMSAGDPSKASAAKAHIRNAIIALVAFFLLYALINFLVPGGVA